jgi:hypothetical protein
MSEKDRGEMIRGMVARLADRLKENGTDVDGWQRLLRAYMVLGERDTLRMPPLPMPSGRSPMFPISSAG